MPRGIYIRTLQGNINMGLAKKGKPSLRKGKTYNDIYGIAKSIEVRKKISQGNSGKIRTQETRLKISVSQKGKPKPPFTEEHLRNLRKPKSEKAKKNMKHSVPMEQRKRTSITLKNKYTTDKKFRELHIKCQNYPTTKVKKRLGMLGHIVSKKTRIKISLGNKGKKRKPQTEEHKRKNRIGVLKYIEKKCGSIRPMLGMHEKKILDELEAKTKNKIVRQFKIKNLGYFLDGYCQETNTAYEVDELRHFDVYGKLKGKDIERQKQIEEELNCKFIRIKDFKE